ncbi:hypothetical protein [Nocardiopsis baichengensis]|uniref:hypothetical protein n=1 Tax=Nocardiopsis baichengensis TaxID=280240 RepID=UPI0003476770|nr:hypothetical protein [Nocardiopsis baichengensis]
MRMLIRAGTVLGAAAVALAPLQGAQAQEADCETVASARDSTGARLWIEVCDPYKVRAGGEDLSPGDTVTLREGHRGRIIGEAVVAQGEDSATTEYWSGYVGYRERPYSHIALVDLDGEHAFSVSETDRSR